jgi:hypothetical protein
MLPGRRGPNRIGPDLWWRQALAHGMLAYYLICRIVAGHFGFGLQPATDAYWRASCFTKELSDDQLQALAPDSPCACDSERLARDCHLS